jgi:hypothetical protein
MLCRLVIVLVGLGPCLLRAVPAAACDPIVLESAEQPAMNATDVPLDALVVVRTSATPPTFTVARTGAAVAADPVDVPGLTGAQAFRSRSPLPANEEIVVGAGGGERRFRTGAAQTAAAPAWEITDSRYEIESNTGCAWNSCAGLETLFVGLRPRTPGALPLFGLFHAGPSGKVDLGRPAVAFVNSHFVDDKGNRQMVINTSASIRKGDRLFVVPVSPAGTPGEPLGPVSVEDEGGCMMAAAGGSVSPLPVLVLVVVFASLRRGEQVGRRGRRVG